MRTWFVLTLAAFAWVPALGAASPAGPAGWELAGNDPSSYSIAKDRAVTRAGSPSGRLMSTRESRGFGTMMQCIDPADYAGKRVRFSGYIKAEEVTSWAGLWMRVDGPTPPNPDAPVALPKTIPLGFDNMQDRPIRGTRDWTRYDVVLDVARDATNICLGILLDGEGKVWLNGVTFEVVGTDISTTGRQHRRSRKPENMGFTR